MKEECLELGLAHLERMPLVVKQDEASEPVDVGTLGTNAVVEDAKLLTDLIKQPCFGLE
jgi:hypothetical protein